MAEQEDNPSKSKGHNDIVQCLIGHDVELQGDITITGGLHIDGKVIGNITVREGNAARMTLSAGAMIDGNVTVNDADINGTIKGDVHARSTVVLYPHSKIDGDVYYESLEIKKGARINGRLIALNEGATKPGNGLMGKLSLKKKDISKTEEKQSA